MAPWPAQGNEPKAPDKSCGKSSENNSAESRKVKSAELEDLDVTSGATKSDDKQPDEKNPDLSNLDDGQLRALLDEAITYKCPKDREGKSHLFRELLQEAEADEGAGGGSSAPQGPGGVSSRHYGRGSRRRRDNQVSERQSRGGSLQNLVQALRRPHGSVSSRQREGGSLPCDVGRDCMVIDLGDLGRPPAPPAARLNGEVGAGEEEGAETVNYTTRATLEVGVKEGEAVDRSVGFPLIQCDKPSTVVNGIEQSPLQLASTYNSVKCIVGGGGGGGGREERVASSKGAAAARSDSVLQGIFPTHLSVLSIPPAHHTLIAAPLGSAGDDGGGSRDLVSRAQQRKKPRRDERTLPRATEQGGAFSRLFLSDTPLTVNYLPSLECVAWDMVTEAYGGAESVSRLPYHSNKDAIGDSKQKSLDENGNSVSQNYRLESNTERKGKPRRTKTNNDRNVIMSQNIEGHRGDKDIESLIKFIESNSEGEGKGKAKASHNGPVFGSKQRSGGGKERPAGGGKAKDRGEKGRLNKCNSLEEVSRTKLEDLGDPRGGVRRAKKPEEDHEGATASADEGPARGRRPQEAPAPLEETDFRVVTKKQRRRKRRSSSGGRMAAGVVSREGQGCMGTISGPRPHRRPRSPEHRLPRRKSTSSVPPSDKSDSSDLDSVHSLPVSSTTTRTTLEQTSTSTGSTPQASYADITRMAACLGPARWPPPGPRAPAPPGVLGPKLNLGAPPVSASRAASVDATTSTADCPPALAPALPPQAVRPPVIIMDEVEGETPYPDISGELTFGFEINEQLLLSGAEDDEEEEEQQQQQQQPEDAREEVRTVEQQTEERNTVPTSPTPPPAPSAVEVFCSMFREPSTAANNHDKIVSFVGTAWEDVVKEMSHCSGSKSYYYSHQC